ncbi:uncharacterized protein LOC101896834 [Musca domestica]|uniref:Uncharacterized protein LOC101896834 n=1 Tax=Musca domestica TaxID=7370 RepID=A0A1I8N183_MUSDO|nr:uncharacterized protein LOC101896834 [Musca domestica]
MSRLRFPLLLLTFTLGAIHCDLAMDPTTCDFDMEDIEQLLVHLPAVCTGIYKRRNEEPQLYASYLAESKAFAKFQKKLNDYELRSENIQEMEVYPFEKDLRMDIYDRANFTECSSLLNGEIGNFLKCLNVKHDEMEQLIPLPVAGSSSSSSSPAAAVNSL